MFRLKQIVLSILLHVCNESINEHKSYESWFYATKKDILHRMAIAEGEIYQVTPYNNYWILQEYRLWRFRFHLPTGRWWLPSDAEEIKQIILNKPNLFFGNIQHNPFSVRLSTLALLILYVCYTRTYCYRVPLQYTIVYMSLRLLFTKWQKINSYKIYYAISDIINFFQTLPSEVMDYDSNYALAELNCRRQPRVSKPLINNPSIENIEDDIPF